MLWLLKEVISSKQVGFIFRVILEKEINELVCKSQFFRLNWVQNSETLFISGSFGFEKYLLKATFYGYQ